METQKLFSGKTENEVWEQVTADLISNGDIYDYEAVLAQDGANIALQIDIDLGGGFEGGYANTTFSTQLHDTGFRFAVHEDSFIDDIGKFLGLQDVKLGYAELDKHLIIKTNDEAKIKAVFTHEKTREVFEHLEDFDFGVRMHHIPDTEEKQAFLELNIEDGVTDPAELRALYSAFYDVLSIINGFTITAVA